MGTHISMIYGKRADPTRNNLHGQQGDKSTYQTTPLIPGFTDSKDKEDLNKLANDEALEKLRILARDFLPTNAKVHYFVSEQNLMIALLKLLGEPFQYRARPPCGAKRIKINDRQVFQEVLDQ